MTRQISLATGEDLVEAPQDRCGSAAFGDRIETLNVFVPVAGLPLQARDPGTARGGHHCEGDARFQPCLRLGGAPGTDRVVGDS